MKTTLELPDMLVKQVKLRAVREGKKLKDAVADLLRKGLAAQTEPVLKRPVIKRHKKTGLPVITGGHPAPPGQELTPDRLAEILLEQEVSWLDDAARR